MGTTSKGVANGLATLGSGGKVTTAQLPLGAAVIAAQVPDLVVSVGTADGTVADVGASFNQTTLNNNFRDISDKLNALLAALRTAGLLTP